MTQVSIVDFLTADEIDKAYALYQVAPEGAFAKLCAAEIITPVIDRINRTLGQENDAVYLAYCVEYVLGRMKS